MALKRTFSPTFGLVLLLTIHSLSPSSAARLIHAQQLSLAVPELPAFREAPAFRNGDGCGEGKGREQGMIHVAMTLDTNYLRGTMAAIFSMLQHATCPENLFFHFMAAHYEEELSSSINTTFPYLQFTIYHFNPNLADVVPPEVTRVIYLDSDLVLVDDIGKLWGVDLEGKVIGAPEYCHANFSQYFTAAFWGSPEYRRVFEGRRPCYFNTGVMVVDLERWREGGYRGKMEGWMRLQKRERIYQLGSLPPFLLVLAGEIKAVDLRWNQHGLGGDNYEGRCRSLHEGGVSLLHWSGKGKPWLRLDSRKPCAVDRLWEPYDLYRSRTFLEEYSS